MQKNQKLSTPKAAAIDELTFNTTPNFLTLLRMLFVPLVVGFLSRDTFLTDWIAITFFSFAAITDWFDGYLARTQNLITVYGKLLDPLADKFLVVCTLICLQSLDRIHPFAVMILICRELGITALRALASAEGVIIEASKGGKWKAALQMTAIPFIMSKEGLFQIPTILFGQVLVYISIALSLWSAKDYAVAFFKALREKRKKKKLQKKQK